MKKKLPQQHFEINNHSLFDTKTINVSEKLNESTQNYHYHNNCQITIIIQGSLELIIEDKPIVIDDSSILMLGMNLAHVVLHSSPDTYVQITHIPYDVLSWMANIAELEPYFKFVLESKKGYLFHSKTLKTKVLSILQRLSKKNGFNQISLLYKMFDLLFHENNRIELINESNRKLVEKNSNLNSLERILNYLYKNYEKEYDLRLYSEIANMNESALCRAFKKRTGKTITQFINRLRIEKACKLLISSEASITEIAFQVGFNTFSHFSTQFQQMLGMSSSQYRDKFNKIE